MAQKLPNEADVSAKVVTFKSSKKSVNNERPSKNNRVESVKIKSTKEKKKQRFELPKLSNPTDVNINHSEAKTTALELTVDHNNSKAFQRKNNLKQSRAVDVFQNKPTFWDNCDFKRNERRVDDADDDQQGQLFNLVNSASNNPTEHDTNWCSLKDADWLNVSNRIMSTKLFRAVVNSQYSMVRKLVKQGLPMNIRNDAGQTLLMVALSIDIDESRDQMFEYLISRGADCFKIDRKTGRDVLGWAAYLGHNIQVRRILDVVRASIDLNRRDVEGRTALHLATLNGHVTVVETLLYVLLNYGLSLDVSDYHDVTPYMTARQRGHGAIARLLARAGACTSLMDISLLRDSDVWNAVCEKERCRNFLALHVWERRDLRVNSRLPPPITHLHAKKYENKRECQQRNSNDGKCNSFKASDQAEQIHNQQNALEYPEKVQTHIITRYINRNSIKSSSFTQRYLNLRALFNMQALDLSPSYRELLPHISLHRGGASSAGSLSSLHDRESQYAGRQSKRRQSSALSNAPDRRKGSAQSVLRSRSRGERIPTSARSRCLSTAQSFSSIESETNASDLPMIPI